MTAPQLAARRKKRKEKEDTRGAFAAAKKRLRPCYRIIRLDRAAWGPEDAHLWTTPVNNNWDNGGGHDAGNTANGPRNNSPSPRL
jgi:hypothetical protein